MKLACTCTMVPVNMSQYAIVFDICSTTEDNHIIRSIDMHTTNYTTNAMHADGFYRPGSYTLILPYIMCPLAKTD